MLLVFCFFFTYSCCVNIYFSDIENVTVGFERTITRVSEDIGSFVLCVNLSTFGNIISGDIRFSVNLFSVNLFSVQHTAGEPIAC